ncbi:amino acid ABC transporter permease [uncultured Friedmanniella sp.]|uniref:amino acid ABC transporter permease n=1 Tax=uncultured Friedmanniella sp. TaxID=335381 RepID=UPI0035C95AFE
MSTDRRPPPASDHPPQPGQPKPVLRPDATGAATPAAQLASTRVVPLRHPWRWVASVVVLLLLAQVVRGLAANPAYQWGVFGYWFFQPIILEGLLVTLKLTAYSAVIGFAAGIVLALMRLSASPVLRSVSWVYIWIFRSIPLIVLLLFLANATALYPSLGLSVPFGPQLFSLDATQLLSYEAAAIIGLSLNEAAYAAEIVRSGLISVDPGQREAAVALGLPRHRRFSRIVLPQAMRAILPSYANQLIGLLKGTSVVYITSLLDLFGQVETQASTNSGEVIPLLMVATVWYVILTTVLSVFQYFVEQRFARGVDRLAQPGRAQRVLAAVLTRRGVAR